ncbi:aspartate aminotransferase family protein [Halodesulfurarchaeum sp.]|uniref:aspartate aminotransferase family protein n=1 Tax=Halodesulfurarchaeum sp. TaxID=1980530 RepID=UPI002FC27FEF
MGGYGSLNLGHNHPAIDEALQQVQEMPNFLQVSIPAVASALAVSVAAVTPGELQQVFISSSGSEAVDGALKLARFSTGKEKILTTDTGYLGTTFGAVSATGKADLRDPFAPLVPGFNSVPFGDTTALRERLSSDEYAVFIVEPVQVEAGIHVPPEGYLKEGEHICERENTLFIADEIQTGLGRSGELWTYDHDGAEPDIMTIGRNLLGGTIPIGAYIATDEVWQAGYGTPDKAMLHASTFTNIWGCAAGLKTLEVLRDDELPDEADELGAYFLLNSS